MHARMHAGTAFQEQSVGCSINADRGGTLRGFHSLNASAVWQVRLQIPAPHRSCMHRSWLCTPDNEKVHACACVCMRVHACAPLTEVRPSLVKAPEANLRLRWLE